MEVHEEAYFGRRFFKVKVNFVLVQNLVLNGIISDKTVVLKRYVI